MIRVVLVDDQTLLRDSLRQLLDMTPDIRVVAEAADGMDAAETIRRARPDVVLLDVRLPGRSGVDVLRELAGAGAPPPTILLTTFDDDEAIQEGLRAGARGFLLKDVAFDGLTSAIREVAGGRLLLRPAVTERARREIGELQPDFDSLDPPDPLTRREVEVLRLIAGGYSNREIAQMLGTSEGTIKNHTSTILSKLGVRDRTRAVLRALERGYI
ncbi:MAG TPA: response regulator transcription factor [Vicinamibacteria bacterium]